MEADDEIAQFRMEALHMVRKLLSGYVEPSRICHGDAKTYFPILFDGLHQRPICRLYFQRKTYLGTISVRKVETKVPIHSVNDIAKFSGEMKAVVAKYIEIA